MPQNQPSGRGLLPSPTTWSPDQHLAAMLLTSLGIFWTGLKDVVWGLVSLSALTQGNVGQKQEKRDAVAESTRQTLKSWNPTGCTNRGGCSKEHVSVSQGRICSNNSTCCHTEMKAADSTFYLNRSQYTDTGPTSPSTDPIRLVATGVPIFKSLV